MGDRQVFRARALLIQAALLYQASVMHNEEDPDDPHGGASIDLHEEMLDQAIVEYVVELDKVEKTHG